MCQTRTIHCRDCNTEVTVVVGMAADRYELCNKCYWTRVAGK